MRIDKFLKVSRLVKRRQVAKDLCDNQRIMVNDKIIKSSFNVSINDKITITYGEKQTNVIVLDIKDSTKKEDAFNMYKMV